MVRCDLTGHRQSFGLGFSDDFDRSGGGKMLSMVASTGFFDQLNIAPEHHFLRQGINPRQPQYRCIVSGVHNAVFRQRPIFTMLREHTVKHGNILHRTLHHGSILYAAAIICKTHGPGL